MNKRDAIDFSNYLDDPKKLKKVIKIAMIGPSRVGKTSIIAALLDEAKTALAQSDVSINPFTDEDGSSPTQARISNTLTEIDAGLECGKFEPTGVGTAYPFIYDLQMYVTQEAKSESKKVIRFAILDYPGGWFTNPPTDSEDAKLWKACQQWIEDSSILIVPIDSNLVMQANSDDKKKRAREILGVSSGTKDLIEVWAKTRWSSQTSALLLFAPVKCESYFEDNGGKLDEAEKLYKLILMYYNDAIKSAIKEMSNQNGQKIDYKKPTYSIEYHPIDTIGCIEIASATWKLDAEMKPENLYCDYLVRNPDGEIPCRKPFGTIGLLISICKQIITIKEQEKGWLQKFFGPLFDHLLVKAISNLSKLKYGPRVKIINEGNLGERKK